MKSLRLPLTIVILLTLAVVGFVLWNRPGRVDMAGYVPADSLVYLEVNSLTEVAKAIEQGELWRAFAPIAGLSPNLVDSLQVKVARAGIGPVKGVVFARAQLALAMVGLDSTEEGDTLRIRPQVVLIVETHTSNWRIKGSSVDVVKQLANYAYGQSNCSERSLFDAHLVECSAAANDRKLVGAIDGTVVIIGNGATAVQHCLEVRRGMRPSLNADVEMQKLRETMQSPSALSFGYISSSNVAKIFSWAAPLLMGKAPGDRQLEGLLSTSASKIFRAVAWTSRGSSPGIEDRYMFSLEPEVIERLKPAFGPSAPATGDFWKLIPQETHSLTIYHQNDLLNAWSALNSAASFKLDAVSAVVFGSVLRSALASYGMDNPNEILPALGSPVATIRPQATDETSVLIARAPDASRIRQILEKQAGNKIQILEGRQNTPDPNREFAAVFYEGCVVIGRSNTVSSWIQLMRAVKHMSSRGRDFEELQSKSNTAITTFSDDTPRVNSFISTVAAVKGTPMSTEQMEKLKAETDNSVFSITETTLNSTGIERKTRSSFGQFSTLVSLAQSDSAAGSRP